MANLGDQVRDKITDFGGVVIGRAEYLYGCVQVLVAPGEVKDGAPVAATWLDEDRTEALPKAKVARVASAATRRGGLVGGAPKVR